jgi:4-amino-4-deoxy-L-arabinose transferase-like glycosyltransferase
VFALCALPRLIALAAFGSPPETQYSELARSLADAHRYVLDGAPTARIEPFCPALFALGRVLFRTVLRLEGAWPMLLAAIVLASLAGICLFTLTREKTGSNRAASIALLLYAFSPYLVRQSASFMEVSVAAALLIAASCRLLHLTDREQTAGLGLILGALVLTRFSFVPIAVGGVLVVWRRHGFGRAAIVAAVAAACVAPWMAYSRASDGSWWPARVGENLFVSTNQWAREIIPATNVDVLVPLATRMAANEPDPDAALLHRAIDYARDHPLEVLRLKARNAMFALLPRLLPFTERGGSAAIVDGRLVIPQQRQRPPAFEWMAGGFQGLLLAGGAAGIWRRRAVLRDDAFLLVVLGSVLALNTIFFPTSRLLAPMTFVLMFYTAAAVAERR